MNRSYHRRMAIHAILAAVLTFCAATLAYPLGAEAQFSGLAETDHHAEPGVPFYVEPVMPSPTVRLQTHIVPTTLLTGSVTQVVFRPLVSFDFSDSVVGEASLPLLLQAHESETRFHLGNPRFGLEFPILVEGDVHRWTLALDLFLPVIQIDDDVLVDSLVDRVDFALASASMPHLVSDFTPEAVGPVIGTHYRVEAEGIAVHAGVDFPMFIDFDFDADGFFEDFDFGLRYGLGVSYAAGQIYPTVEFVGFTALSADEVETAALVAAGVRGAFNGFEPGIAVGIPVSTALEAIDSAISVSIELAYRFE